MPCITYRKACVKFAEDVYEPAEDSFLLADAALKFAKKGMKILVMHVGGEGRRGTLTDLFINAAVPFGERLILVKGGNNDGLFNKLAKKGAPITEVATVAAVQAPLEQALKDWKILP